MQGEAAEVQGGQPQATESDYVEPVPLGENECERKGGTVTGHKFKVGDIVRRVSLFNSWPDNFAGMRVDDVGEVIEIKCDDGDLLLVIKGYGDEHRRGHLPECFELVKREINIWR